MSKDDKKPDYDKLAAELATMTALGNVEAEVYGQSGYKLAIVEPKK